MRLHCWQWQFVIMWIFCGVCCEYPEVILDEGNNYVVANANTTLKRRCSVKKLPGDWHIKSLQWRRRKNDSDIDLTTPVEHNHTLLNTYLVSADNDSSFYCKAIFTNTIEIASHSIYIIIQVPMLEMTVKCQKVDSGTSEFHMTCAGAGLTQGVPIECLYLAPNHENIRINLAQFEFNEESPIRKFSKKLSTNVFRSKGQFYCQTLNEQPKNIITEVIPIASLNCGEDQSDENNFTSVLSLDVTCEEFGPGEWIFNMTCAGVGFKQVSIECLYNDNASATEKSLATFSFQGDKGTFFMRKKEDYIRPDGYFFCQTKLETPTIYSNTVQTNSIIRQCVKGRTHGNNDHSPHDEKSHNSVPKTDWIFISYIACGSILLIIITIVSAVCLRRKRRPLPRDESSMVPFSCHEVETYACPQVHYADLSVLGSGKRPVYDDRSPYAEIIGQIRIKD